MPKSVICLCCIFASWWISTGALSANLDRVIAIVNDDAITLSDYETYFSIQQLGSEGEVNVQTSPFSVDKEELDVLIDQRLQLQEADRNGLRVTSNELDSAISNISQQNGISKDALLAQLASSNITESEFKQSIRDQILIQKVVNMRVSQNVRVNEQEIDQFVKSYPDLFAIQTSYDLSHLRIGTQDIDSGQFAVRRNYLESVRNGILDGQEIQDALGSSDIDDVDFEYLGWRSSSQIPDQIVAAIETAKPKSVTEILELPDALHLFVIHASEGDEIMTTQYRLRQILINPNQKSITDDEALQLAREIAEKIKGGEDFSNLARLYSDDRTSSNQGGELNWLNSDEISPQILTIVSRLDPNQLSEPISTLYGYFLIEVLETRTQNTIQDVIRGRARDMIFDRKANSQFDSWIGRIRSESYIEILGVN